MKKLTRTVVLVLACVVSGPAIAGSPTLVTNSVSGTTTNAYASPPISGSSGFRLESVLFGDYRGPTQTNTLFLIQSGETNAVQTVVVTAASRTCVNLVSSNLPWLFQGDKIGLSTDGTNAMPVVMTGITQN